MVRVLASLFHPAGTWLFSGSEKRFCALTQEWGRNGVETFALEPRPFASATLPARYTPIEVPLAGRGLVGELGTWILRSLSRGLDASRRFRFDLVYATNNNLFNLAASEILARRLSIPLVAVVHHLRWVYYGDLESGKAGRTSFAKLVKRLGSEGLRIDASLARAVGAYAESRLLRQCDGFITVSKVVRDQLAGLVNPDRIFVAGNGVRTSLEEDRSSGTRGMDAIFVGRLDEGKGLLELLNLWQRVSANCPAANLHVVGEGSLRNALLEETIARGLSGHLNFHGFSSYEQISYLQVSTRLFISLSRIEGFGLAMVEALAAGLPVLVWDTPPMREIFGTCPAVTLVPTGDTDRAASTTIALLRLPDTRWQELSRKAREYSRNFSWEEVAARELRAMRIIQEAKESNR